tara:strand:- start:2640 stop:3407 length:768 start_codon:yes stop_codon:yes gene_type:complete
MKDIPRLLPIWVTLLLLLIIIQQCGCRGGRSLGNGSAGTIITPQTPQEINESNREEELPRLPMPPLEPLPPVPIVPPQSSPIVTAEAVRSNSVEIESKSAKANPVIVNPKSAGELKSLTPTINRNAPPVNLPTIKLPKENNKEIATVITPQPKSSQSDNKATSVETKVGEKKDKVTFNWGELVLWWMFLFLVVIFGWVIFDIINDCIKNLRNGKKAQSLSTKKKSPKVAAKKTAKKTAKKAAKKTVKKKPINKKK